MGTLVIVPCPQTHFPPPHLPILYHLISAQAWRLRQSVVGVTHPDGCFEPCHFICSMFFIDDSNILHVLLWYSTLRPCETQCYLQYSMFLQYPAEHFKGMLCGKKSWKVSNKNCFPCRTVTRETPLRRMCLFCLHSNATKHQGTGVKKLCTEQWFDSTDCQMASLLCSMRSPGGLHKHMFTLFAATTVI